MTTEADRCLAHGSKVTYCAVTKTWSASDVMKGCGCVFEVVVVGGITARVSFRVRRPKKSAKPAQVAA